MLRLANADVLPFDYSILVKTIGEYVADVKTSLELKRSDDEMLNRLIKEKVYELAKDPTLGFAGPTPKQLVPYLDFSSIDNAMTIIRISSEELKSAIEKAGSADVQKRARLNEILYQSEQKLLNPNGLPRRPWYKHMIYAPGFYTGYGVKTLPGIREGIEENNWKEAQDYINIVANTLLQFNLSLQKGIEALR